ncbi:DNA polymerase III subunit gamma and tau [Gordonia sp. NPDC003425]
MALYRTYRPATFAEVVGQEHVTDPLSRALDSGRINHAYLFSGPRGCGKTSSARILARSLNCEQGPTSTPCGVCSSCVALAPGGPGNLDVIELDAASHGGVDDTRELRDRAFYAPSESRYRVFIVDEAHMVTNAGFNALLKIVEEPPEHLIFVFATTEPEKVLPTIRSRTHHYPFRLLAPPVMRGLLERICAKEGVTVAPDVFPLVIRAGGGSPRDSLSILDQLLAGASDEGVTYDRALALLGVTDIALIDDAIDALATADGAGLFATVEKVVDAGHDPRRFAVDLLERLRDLILLQAVPDAAQRGLVEAPGDQLARMNAQIEKLGPGGLTRFAEIVHTALGEMRGTTSPRLLLEVMCARMLLPAVSDDEAAVLQRLERLESGVRATAPSAPTASPSGEGSAAPPPPPPSDDPPKYVRPSQRKAEPSPEPVEPPAETPTAPQPVADKPVAEQSVAPQPVAPQPVAPQPVAEKPPVEKPPSSPQPPAVTVDDDIPLPEEPVDESAAPPDEPGVARRPAAQAAEPVSESPPPTDTGLDVDTVQRRLQEVRSAVRERSKSIEPMLSAAVIVDLDDDVVVFGHPVEVLVGRLSAPHAVSIIREALREVFGTDLDVRTIHQAPGAAAPSASAAPTKSTPNRRAQTYARPSRARGQSDSGERPVAQPETAAEPEEPEPPRPDDEIPDAERAEMVAEAHRGGPGVRVDQDKLAMELLQNELGARPLE